MRIEIALFASSSLKGRELEKTLGSESLMQSITSLLMEKVEKSIEVEINSIHSDAPEYEFHKAVLYSDVVLFDGSLEEDVIALGENYACIPHAPYLMDNVIVVSRTELPINFIPNAYQTNVVPVGEETKEERERNPQKRYTNEEIIEWLKGCFVTMIEEGRLPRKPEFKIAKELLTDCNSILNYFNRIYSLTKGNKKNRYEYTAFISYRSFYGEHKSNGYSIKELEKVILDYHKEHHPTEKWRVMYYTSGSLAQDCLTEYRRWGLMEYVNYIFKQVDEVWVFNTHDTKYGPSYWDSWFTQGEFISLMNLQHNMPHCCPKIMMFDSSTEESKELTDLPKIPKDLKRELSIVTANSDTVCGDISAYKRMCIRKQNWDTLPRLERIGLIVLSRVLYKTNLKKQLTSHLYDTDFLTNRIFSCPNCLKKGNDIDSFKSKGFIRDFLNIYSPMPDIQRYNNKRGYFALNNKEFAATLETGIVKCPNCGKVFKITESKVHFYIWERNLPPLDIDHKYIDKVQAYNIEEVG